MQLQRVNAICKILCQNIIHYAMALQAGFTSKCISLDRHLKMRATAFAPSGMACMFMADILNLNLTRI
jgi:hypothetical protein